jgi:hypothetical protein
MVLIEQGDLGRQIVHKKSLISSIAITIRRQTDAVDDATRISINNKNRFISRIQYYGIGCLQTNTIDGKELLAKLLSTFGKQFAEVITAVFSQPLN